MRKNIFKVLTATLAFTIFMASPSTTMTAHAIGFDTSGDYDNTERDEVNWDDFGGSNSSDSGLADSGSSYEEPSQPEYTEPSNSESSDSGSSSDNNSDSDSGSGNNSVSSSNTSTNTASDSGYTAPALTKNLNNVTVKVDGGQKFRITANTERTVYHIYHCGINRASFKATDADGNATAFSTVTLAKGNDGLWYLNVTFAEGVDTEGLTMTVTKGDATYLSTELGVSGIKIETIPKFV